MVLQDRYKRAASAKHHKKTAPATPTSGSSRAQEWPELQQSATTDTRDKSEESLQDDDDDAAQFRRRDIRRLNRYDAPAEDDVEISEEEKLHAQEEAAYLEAVLNGRPEAPNSGFSASLPSGKNTQDVDDDFSFLKRKSAHAVQRSPLANAETDSIELGDPRRSMQEEEKRLRAARSLRQRLGVDDRRPAADLSKTVGEDAYDGNITEGDLDALLRSSSAGDASSQPRGFCVRREAPPARSAPHTFLDDLL